MCVRWSCYVGWLANCTWEVLISPPSQTLSYTPGYSVSDAYYFFRLEWTSMRHRAIIVPCFSHHTIAYRETPDTGPRVLKVANTHGRWFIPTSRTSSHAHVHQDSSSTVDPWDKLDRRVLLWCQGHGKFHLYNKYRILQHLDPIEETAVAF